MKPMDIIGTELKGGDIVPFLVEVTIPENGFLTIKESLTRIGIIGDTKDDKPTLNQTCHILTKRGRYYICHFKTMFVLDGRSNCLTSSDIARQNTIAKLLEDWKLLNIVNPSAIDGDLCSAKTIKIIKYQDRADWNLVSKYDVGAKARTLKQLIKA